MPANLTPQYLEAEKRYRQAKDIEDKLFALQQMLAVMPRHKGTDKLHADLRRKIAKLSQENEKRNSVAKRAGFFVEKEGAAQVVFVGHSNVGKSYLLSTLTQAVSMVAEYPFTTQTLIPGMMIFENVQIQLVDTPPLEHKNIRVLLGNTLRRADLIIIVVSLESNAVEQLKSALEILKEIRIEFPVDGESITPGSFTKKSLILANKSDHPGTSKNLSELSAFSKDKFTMISASAATGDNIDNLKKIIFHELEIIRIYTKVPGTKADLNDPMVINKGDTVDIAAEAVHKDFRSKLKYAIVWGSGVYDGQRVSRKHVLKDGDIIEFHI